MAEQLCLTLNIAAGIFQSDQSIYVNVILK